MKCEISAEPNTASSSIRVVGAWHVQNVYIFGSRLRHCMARFKRVSGRYLEITRIGPAPSTGRLGLVWTPHRYWS